VNRCVTFRFDDGYIGGAMRAAALLNPSPASFFVVTGRIGDEEFGTLEQWRELSKTGHDVQAHSATHSNFHKLDPARQYAEVRESLAVIRSVHDGPYAFCFPYNAITNIDLEAEGFSAAGFVSSISDSPVNFNRLTPKPNMFELKSWAVREPHLADVTQQLGAVPDESWVILGLHSLDGIGWEPWTSRGLEHLIRAVRELGYRIVSVAEML